MKPVSARIERLVFDLATDTAARGVGLQNQTSRFAQQRLAHMLQQCTAAYALTDTVYHIDSLVLDVGQLDAHRFDSDLETSIASALHAWLRRQLGPPPLRAATPVNAAAPSLTDPLSRLLDGATAISGSPGLSGEIAAALAQRPAQLLDLLRHFGVRHALRMRLARELPEPLIGRIVGLLAPSQVGAILCYAGQIQAAHRLRPLVAEQREPFRVVVWEFVLTYLLLERSSHFATVTLVDYTLRQLAGRYRLSYQWLLAQLAACAAEITVDMSGAESLPAIVRELQGRAQESDSDAGPVFLSAVSTVAGARQHLAAVAGFFERGLLPWSAQGQDMPDIVTLMTLVADALPGELVVLLRRLGSQASVRRRLANQLPDAALEQVVTLLEPRAGASIRSTLRHVRNVQQASPIVPGGGARFNSVLWEFVLESLLNARGSYFNTRSFIKSLLLKMAARYGLAYTNLLDTLIQLTPLHAQGVGHPGALPAILVSLRHEEQRRTPVAPPVADSGGLAHGLLTALNAGTASFGPADAALASLLAPVVAVRTTGDADDALLYFLEWGCAPANRNAFDLPQLLHCGTLLRDTPEFLSALRRRCTAAAARTRIITRLLHYALAAQLDQLLDRLAPAGAGLIRTWHLAGAAINDGAPQSRLQWHAGLDYLLSSTGAVSLADFLRVSSDRLTRQVPDYAARLLQVVERASLTHPRFQALRDLLHQAAAPATPSGTAPAAIPQAPPADDAGNDDAGNAVGQLRYWLRHARWPTGDADAARLTCYVRLIAREPLRYRGMLLQAASGELERMRIAYALPSALRAQILVTLLQADSGPARRWLSLLARGAVGLGGGLTARRWQGLFTDALLQTSLKQQHMRYDAVAFVAAALEKLQQHAGKEIGTLQAGLQQLLARRQPTTLATQHAELDEAARRLRLRPALPPVAVPPRAAARPLPEAEETGQGILVHNAGLVILWPYLERYFSMLGLLEGKHFASAEPQSQAIHLLQYLSCGDWAAPEHTLALNKLLCGMALDEVLLAVAAPDEQARQVSAQLLQGVVGNWQQLKNTSPAGLQETFLRREGRLVRKGEYWSLTVQSSTFDVLLPSLPWSIASIHLPWMERMLMVSWK